MVRSGSDEMKKPPRAKGGTKGQSAGKPVGEALRQAYDETLNESIPAEMLDLLKKLD